MSATSFIGKLYDSFRPLLGLRRRVCLAVSGGADSVALLRGVVEIAERHKMRDHLICLTVDHGLRGEESAEDADFVVRLAESLRIKARLLQANVDEIHEKAKRLKSLEGAARDARYKLLYSATKECGASCLLTAHHRGDQLETILFRLFRGVGLDGLNGIERVRKVDESLVLVRPMLDFTKEEILTYLGELGQEYREDSSNSALVFSRNQVRNELVPVLDSIFPGKWQNALLRLSALGKEEGDYLESQVDRLEEEILRERLREEKRNESLLEMNAAESTTRFVDSPDAATFPADPLRRADVVLIRRYFRRLWERLQWSTVAMGYDEWNRLADAVKKRTPTQPFPGGVLLTFPQPNVVMLERKVKTRDD